jgi:hypothetical protein
VAVSAVVAINSADLAEETERALCRLRVLRLAKEALDKLASRSARAATHGSFKTRRALAGS